MNFRVSINANKEKANQESKTVNSSSKIIVVTTLTDKIKNLQSLYEQYPLAHPAIR